jgi:hypothetical protein
MEEELTTRNSVSEHALLQEHSLDTEQVTVSFSQPKVSNRYNAALAPNCPVPVTFVPQSGQTIHPSAKTVQFDQKLGLNVGCDSPTHCDD